MKLKFWEPKIVIKIVEVERQMDEVELASKLAELLGDLNSVDLTKDGAKDIYRDMGRIDGSIDAYKEIMMNDIKRYFAAQTEKERDTIRGAFARTAYLRSQMLDSTRS